MLYIDNCSIDSLYTISLNQDAIQKKQPMYLDSNTKNVEIKNSGQTKKEKNNNKSIAIYYAIGNGDRIQNILEKVKLSGDVSRFFGIGYSLPIKVKWPVGFDMQLLKHFGKQNSFEFTFSLAVKSKHFYNDKIAANFAIGNGVSYLTRPSFAIEGSNKVRPKKMLIYHETWNNFSLTFRWHHRCHIFGRIAAKGIGSNFFAIGVRYYFK